MILAKHETQKFHFKALSKACRVGSIVGISHHYGALRFLMGHARVVQCASLIESNKHKKSESEFIQKMPDSYSAFILLSVVSQKNRMRLFKAIKRNNQIQSRKNSPLRNQLRKANNKELRKQNDDAPKGADSIGGEL
ncbi:hypothetical protein F0249_19205 [Vibrio sp. 03-59-1]|uniref:hypothetical protein n=1 Tax=Vibrio sp. 03-59-1 TaxID=2607607 RepID=UPI001493C6FD|nr:hypothetical protein [Vibrio sp. 03-59-1]NOH85918.1 hypothetical protein [Vibrio sp. 03-59-1]